MEEKNNKELSSDIRFLTSILNKITGITNNLDSQINILLGIASAMFLYSTSKLTGDHKEVFFVLNIFSAISVLVGLFTVHPPRYFRIKNKDKTIANLTNNQKIISFGSAAAYADELEKVLGDKRKITEQYAVAIFDLCIGYYRPKRNMFKLASKLLIAGIALSALTAIYMYILN